MTFNAPSKYFTRLISLQIPTSTLILRRRAKNFVILDLLVGVSSTTRSWYLARFLEVPCNYLSSPDEIQILPSKLDKFSRALESLILRKPPGEQRACKPECARVVPPQDYDRSKKPRTRRWNQVRFGSISNFLVPLQQSSSIHQCIINLNRTIVQSFRYQLYTYM